MAGSAKGTGSRLARHSLHSNGGDCGWWSDILSRPAVQQPSQRGSSFKRVWLRMHLSGLAFTGFRGKSDAYRTSIYSLSWRVGCIIIIAGATHCRGGSRRGGGGHGQRWDRGDGRIGGSPSGGGHATAVTHGR